MVTAAAADVREGSGAVVPFGRVPLMKMVFVPLTSATFTRLEFVGSLPFRIESKNVRFVLSSHPQTEYSWHRQTIGSDSFS